ncbi:hypothetical protein TrST_g2332 [Triparma strigata]|uniref:TOG domain-containing protein n=1 Tax=Triparma strigata TaxID=1606541 RepID=A0A9W7E0M0_9STRA|nr:hypothetical protein TrST_g2332 [Triparma strigata]
MSTKVAFRVVACDEEDPDYPVTELNTHSHATRGWQSPRFCNYPQDIGFELGVGIDGSPDGTPVTSTRPPVRMRQVQILSHQCKIATKIEVFTALATGPNTTFQNAQFQRLGYLSLDSNARSQFQARELKSVYIDSLAHFLKIRIHRCYINKFNLYNQVGIVALNVLGEGVNSANTPQLMSPSGMLASPLPIHQQMASPPPQVEDVFSSPQQPQISSADVSFDASFPPQAATMIKSVLAAKERAVSGEDFDLAAQLKGAEGEIMIVATKLSKLEAQKKAAVASEDYEKAKSLKGGLADLRAEVQAAIDKVMNEFAGLGIDLSSPSKQERLQKEREAREAAERMRQEQLYQQQQQQMQREREMQMQQASPPPTQIQAPQQPSPQELQQVQEQPHEMRPSPQQQEMDPYAEEPPPQYAAVEAPPPYVDPMEAPLRGAKGAYPDLAGDETTVPPPGNLHSSGNMAKTGGRMGRNIQYNENMDSEEEFDISTDDVGTPAKNDPQPFPEGEHPLDNIPGVNSADLPEPDPMPASTEGYPIDVLGSYLIRCLHSKNWSLREAALAKICVMISDNTVPICEDKHIAPFCNVIKKGVNDSISHVMLTAFNVLQDCVNAWSDGNMQRSSLTGLDGALMTVLTKFGDANGKIRGEASATLSFVADASCVGPSHVAALVMKPLPKKQANAPKPIASRLGLLTELIDRYGVRDNTGLSAAGVMAFAKTVNGFAHTSAEVRKKTKQLTVAVHAHIGKSVEKYLTSLRPKQLQEYKEEWEGDESDDENVEVVNKGRGRGRGRGGGGVSAARDEDSGIGKAIFKPADGNEQQYGDGDEELPDTFTYE